MRKNHLLFLTIFIEGYVVLAAELLAMRQLVPFVGSGTEIIAIVISAVLMPLAIGYHYGGTTYRRLVAKHKRFMAHPRPASRSVRRVLLKNLLSALVILGIGLSYLFMEVFFTMLHAAGLHHRMAQATLYVLLFLVWPVFLLGQTVPIVSHYFSRRNLSEITGRMLFFSTTGSFFGSVFSTIVLMSVIGVHYTVIFTMVMLASLVPMLARRFFCYETFLAAFVICIVVLMNNDRAMKMLRVVSNNAYNTVMIQPVKGGPGSRILNVNRSSSSKISDDPEKHFAYWKYIQRMFITPISDGDQPPKDILVIGAGGFSLGQFDTHNRYTFIDIDPALKEVSEKYFLQHKISENKIFAPLSARAFLRQDNNRYDLIILDTFSNVIAIPMECTTREYFQAVKDHLKPDGIVISNVILSPTFDELFTVRYFNTFASVFPQFTTQVLGSFNGWGDEKSNVPGLPPMRNVLYIYHDSPKVGDLGIYTDNQNTYSLDR